MCGNVIRLDRKGEERLQSISSHALYALNTNDALLHSLVPLFEILENEPFNISEHGFSPLETIKTVLEANNNVRNIIEDQMPKNLTRGKA